MPSLGDSAVIIFLGLLLFGPKGLAQIARQLGKLMGEFRRASNEFRMQMEEELRISEQADKQKQIAAIEAAAPVAPLILNTPAEEALEDHPHMRVAPGEMAPAEAVPAATEVESTQAIPVPIASSGGLNLMPPATGLPLPRSSVDSSFSLSALIDSVPQVEMPSPAANGHDPALQAGLAEKPMRYTNGHRPVAPDSEPLAKGASSSEEPLHG